MHPSAREKARQFRVGFGVCGNGGLDFGERLALPQVELVERLSHHHEMHVAVDEAWEEGLSVEVLDCDVGVGESGGDFRVGGGTDESDGVILYEQCGGEGWRPVEASVGAGGNARQEDIAIGEKGCHFESWC